MPLCTRPEQTIAKVITLTANAGSQRLNCFQLTGSVQVTKLYGVVTTATTFATCTAASFQLWDSTAAIDLTANTGDLSALAIGTCFAKVGLAAAVWGLLDNVAGALLEPAAAGQVFSQFIVTQKAAGAATFIALNYTTADAPIAATFTITAEFVPMSGGNLVTV